MKSVEITLSGVAIAKWLSMKGGSDLRKVKMRNLALKAGGMNIYVDVTGDIGAFSETDLPYMGEDTSVTLLVNPKAYEDVTLGVGQIAITAICAAMDEGIPVDQCNQIEVRVIDAGR